MIGDVFEHDRGELGDLSGHDDRKLPAAAHRRHHPQDVAERDAVAAENVALADAAAFHGQHEAHGDVADVDQVDQEVEMRLHLLLEEVPQHRGRRRQIVVGSADGHGRRADHEREARGRRLCGMMLGERLRSRIGAGHRVGRLQRLFGGNAFEVGIGEQDRFGRAVQEARDTALHGSREHDLGAAAIHVVKVLLVGDPHAGQAGEVIDLIDTGDRSIDRGAVQHRAVDVFNVGIRCGRHPDIKNTDPLPTGAERFDEMMSDEATATGNQDESHAEGCCFAFGVIGSKGNWSEEAPESRQGRDGSPRQ